MNRRGFLGIEDDSGGIPYAVDDEDWIGVPWNPGDGVKSKSLRETITRAEREIKELKHDLKVIHFGDKHANPIEERPEKTRALKQSFSTRIVTSDTQIDGTNFQTAFDNGELPVAEGDPDLRLWAIQPHPTESRSKTLCKRVGNHIVWTLPPGFSVRHLDFSYYLPLFMDGLTETTEPYSFIAELAVRDLITCGGRNYRLHTILRQCIPLIKNTLKSENHDVIRRGLAVLQHLMVCDHDADEAKAAMHGLEGGASRMLGLVMRSYFKTLVPSMFVVWSKLKALRTKQAVRLSDMVVETLELMERYGGAGAFLEIKQNFPEYISVTSN
uniref:Uncharacterized protein n=2 Tax=Octactis speculum TaxID=3111310 RepID=A0A7S2GH59_9STRA|mmetsp:Transcript_466/g.615  ORF Transcript_466/g.615 Transcript_466/m.615 type:complete len:327 (+) Transcript_466:2-982(+)